MSHARMNGMGIVASLLFGLVPLCFAGCGAPESQDSLGDSPVLGTVTSALLTPKVTEVTGFAIPDALLDAPLRTIIRSTSEATLLLGSVPTGVDFSKEFLLFYAAGKQPTLGYRAEVSLLNVYVEKSYAGGEYRYRLRAEVATLLDPPGSGCPAELPGVGRPFTLVRADATGVRNYSLVSSHQLGHSHKDNQRTCAAEPGPACDGTVTPAGLDAINLRPGGATPTYTTNRSYAEHLLGSYTVERWQWDCKAAACSWLQLPPQEWGPSYMQAGRLYYYSGSEERLVLFSGEGFAIFYSSSGVSYPCWLWGEDGFGKLNTRSGTGVVSSASITGNQVCSVAPAANYHHKDLGMNDLSGVMGDRCARLTSQTGTGPGSVIQVLVSSW